MDDDLGVPAALAAVHASVRDGNQALAASDKAGVRASLVQARAMLGRARPGPARAAVGGSAAVPAPAPATGCGMWSARW